MDYPGKVITKTQVTPTQTSASGNWTLDDQAAAIKNNNWPVALVPNPISKSLRFNSADSAYLNRTPASAGNRKTWTWSGWVKRSALASGGFYSLFGAGTTSPTYDGFRISSDALQFYQAGAGSVNLVTTSVYRDVSAWYHIVLAVDTSQATTSNRVKIYVNGTQVTAFSTANYPTQNAEASINNTLTHVIGATWVTSASLYYDGYMTEINFIDGQQLTPSSFGMTNPQTGQWIPLKYSGTYGTNGFYLNFKDATSTTTLGYDYSGNANNWATTGFSVTAGAGNDSLTDVPTPWVAYNTTGDVGGVIRGNYATWNPLIAYGSTRTVSNGNLLLSGTVSGANQAYSESTIYGTDGKWYAEFVPQNLDNNNSSYIGFFGGVNRYYAPNGQIFNGSTWASYGATYTSGNTIGVAVDVTNKTVEFFKNGASQGQITGLTALTYCAFFCSANSSTATPSWEANFGQRPFAYTPPTGFRSLCTTNLPATAIGFGPTNQGNNYFDVTTYTGDGAVRSITNSGSMQPDFVWDKLRSGANSHRLFDAVRGVEKALYSNLTNAETTETGTLTAFNSNGFSLGTNTETNTNGSTYVAWQWRASNATAVTNTAGSITSTVSANTTAGFSIVTYTGTGANATVGHGLGVAPSMMIIKSRSGARSWIVYHVSIGNTGSLFLDLTNATNTASFLWNNTSPTSSVFTIGIASTNNTVSENYVAYCFAPVAGYSAFGSYTGNGSSDGPFVFCNFRPRYVMYKRTDTTGNWIVYDTARNTYNLTDTRLSPNLADAEVAASTSRSMDILSNGFKLRGASVDTNASAGTYIYAAFAESPFQFSNAR